MIYVKYRVLSEPLIFSAAQIDSQNYKISVLLRFLQSKLYKKTTLKNLGTYFSFRKKLKLLDLILKPKK